MTKILIKELVENEGICFLEYFFGKMKE